ncbi:MAG: hypothetical protein RL630_817 [Verrucomicrobiota bacterium]
MNMAFKEWAVVCEALGSGRQSVILRKGGIAEGRNGFAFLHREFFLFPTRFHETLEKTTLQPGFALPAEREGEVEIRFVAKMEWTCFLSDPEQLAALSDFHILRREVIEERFRFGKPPGLHVGFARIYRMSSPWFIPMEKRFGGCRSWVELPASPEVSMEPVLSDEENQRRSESLCALLQLA